MAPGVFDGKACFAYAAQPMNRLASCETNRSPLPAHESLPELYKRGVATFKERAEGVVRKVNHSARCLHTAGWEPQFPDSSSELLAVGKPIINVAALLNSAPVGKLKFLFLIRLRGEFIRLVILRSYEQIERFLKFPRYVVFDLGVRTSPLARRTLRRFRSIVKAGQMDYGVAPTDETAQHCDERAVSELEIAFLDRKDLERKQRVFDLPAKTAQVARGRGNKDLGVLGHASMVCNALGEGEQKSRAATPIRFLSKNRLFRQHSRQNDPFCSELKKPLPSYGVCQATEKRVSSFSSF